MFRFKFYNRDEYFVFLKSLPNELSIKVIDLIQNIEDGLIELKMPYSRLIRDKIFELRVKQSTNIVRLLYFYDKGKIIVITNYYLKKAEKVDEGELSKAIMRRKRYLNL